jgi:hypothetical protein
MGHTRTLKAIIKRGALITLANWQVVVVLFVAESLFKLLLGVPLAGGIVLMAIAVGHDVTSLFEGEVDARELLTKTVTGLATRPAGLGGFLAALFVMLAGGSALTFVAKAGTMAILTDADRAAGPIEQPPLRWSAFARAQRFSADAFLNGCSRLWRRYVRLGLMLSALYALSAILYLSAVVIGYATFSEGGATTLWTALAALGSTVLVIWITLTNLAYLLIQMVMAADDVGVRVAARRVVAYIGRQFRPLASVFLVVLALVVVGTAASVVTTAALSLISFVPLLGLAVFPLQATAWLLRGLLFQYLGLAALGAYLTLYREGA